MKVHLTLLAASILLAACSSPAPRPESGLQAPASWHSPASQGDRQQDLRWWTRFGSPELD
ncbi:RND transporter, partial [Pseudomonas protegens]